MDDRDSTQYGASASFGAGKAMKVDSKYATSLALSPSTSTTDTSAMNEAVKTRVCISSAIMHTRSEDDSCSFSLLDQLPTELRLLVFSFLLTSPKPVACGIREFRQHLPQKEIGTRSPIYWQILSTCRQYYREAMPILYGKNELIFCTARELPGSFARWPVNKRCLAHVTRLRIYMSLQDTKNGHTKHCVTLFLCAVQRHAHKLQSLTLLISLSCGWIHECPLKIMFAGHPVAEVLSKMVAAPRAGLHIKIRLHDEARLAPKLGRALKQTFYENRDAASGGELVFTRSCVCRKLYTIWSGSWPVITCKNCGRTFLDGEEGGELTEWSVEAKGSEIDNKDFTRWLQDPEMERMLWDEYNGWSDASDDEKDDDSVEDPDVYGCEFEDEDDDLEPMWRRLSRPRDGFEGEYKALHSGSDDQRKKYKGTLVPPSVWFYRQTTLDEYCDYLPDPAAEMF